MSLNTALDILDVFQSVETEDGWVAVRTSAIEEQVRTLHFSKILLSIDRRLRQYTSLSIHVMKINYEMMQLYKWPLNNSMKLQSA